MLKSATLVMTLAAQSYAAMAQDIRTSEPITIFNEVCLGDEVQLSRSTFARTQYAALPRPVKEALGFSVPSGPFPLPGAKNYSLAESEVPNQFFAVVPSKRAYLMLPGSPEVGGLAARQCAVIWQGRHYAEALKAAQNIRPLPDPQLPSGAALSGFGFSVIRSQGAIIGVAEYGDWTVLRIAADTSPQEQE